MYSCVSSAYWIWLTPKDVITLATGDIYRLNKIGPRTEPCGTPNSTTLETDYWSPTLTNWDLSAGKTWSSPAHDREFRKWTPVYAGAYSSQSYRKRQRDRGGSRCSETSHPQPDRDRWGDAEEQFPWNGRDGRQTGNGWSWEKSSRDRWYFLRTIFRVSLRCC